MEKIIIITLLFLTPEGIGNESFEIFESCGSWYERNVRVLEKKKKFFSKRYYYMYKGKQVVGYVCNDRLPT